MQYGNFKNYYNFYAAEERINLLPRDIWLPKDSRDDNTYLVLDVGCNAGNLTQLLWAFLKSHLNGKEIYVLGIDRDDELIERAIEQNQQSQINYAHLDVTLWAATSNYISPIDTFLQNHQRSHFDAVCCFSITMWIHLNNHDSGLQNFLKNMSDISKLLVIEPQPWKCYQTANRRLKKSGKEFPLFKQLKWRFHIEKLIDEYLELELKRFKVYECCPSNWGRKVCFYR